MDRIVRVSFEDGDFLRKNLRKHFSSERLEGWRCSSCLHVQDVDKSIKLEVVPEVLVIQLKRFDESGDKKMDRISFPEYLDLSPYTKGESSDKYGLTCVVHHRASLHSGHYITVAKCPNGQWMQIDDNTVTPARLRAARNPPGGWTPYILFYHRIAVPSLHDGAKTNLKLR